MNHFHQDRPSPELATKLDADHDQLERTYIDLTERAATGDCRECDCIWTDFARQLESHMAFEEREIFPSYAQKGHAEAANVERLLAEHAAIRSQLAAIGIDLQLHLTDAEVIGTLLQALRDHARRERENLYPRLTA